MANSIFHIILSPSGLYLWWTLAPTEDESWDALKRDYPNIALAKQRGCRCARVELTLVEERKR
jgi:hypothetical protein